MSSVLAKEFEFYVANQKELVGEYEGRVLGLKDGRVIGVYDTELEAVSHLGKSHELGTFLIQRVTEGDEAYTHTFHSRAVFS